MMHNAVAAMLEKYDCRNVDDHVNALKEIIQEIALRGLYRADFFSIAAFYGETSLRIFHGLDRSSEVLDFSLLDSRWMLNSKTKALKRISSQHLLKERPELISRIYPPLYLISPGSIKDTVSK